MFAMKHDVDVDDVVVDDVDDVVVDDDDVDV